MSDDEEVILERSDLCKYLIDQGYSDFKILESGISSDEACKDKRLVNVPVVPIGKPSFQKSTKTLENTISVSNHDKLLGVLHSQLLFKEDHDELETILSTTCVVKEKQNFCTSAGLGAVILSYLALYRPNPNLYTRVGISIIFTVVSTWYYYTKYKECSKNKLFTLHIKMLQNLCLNIHKIFRSIKEIEILSSLQVSTQDNVSHLSLPAGLGLHPSKELHKFPSWKTLPHFHSCLEDVLIMAIDTLIQACKDTSVLGKSTSIALEEHREALSTIANQSISLKGLQNLIDVYLAVQSEYLKNIAISFTPIACNILNKQGFVKKENLFKTIYYVQSKLNNLLPILIYQHHINNTSNIRKHSYKQTGNSPGKNIKKLQTEMHNISLLMLYSLLRVRGLEDLLEEIAHTKGQNELHFDITSQLTSLNQDLKYVINYYDTVCSQMSCRPSDKIDLPSDEVTINDIAKNHEQTSLKTGVKVGQSDFKVNSLDEVFIALSGLNSQDHEHVFNEWSVENKPQMPNNLLAELNYTLKERKLEYIKREKLALERKGQQDFEVSSSESELEETEYKENNILTRTFKGPHFPSYDFCSDSLSNCDSSLLDSGYNLLNKSHMNETTNSSLANLIAMKSQLWNKTEEESYSDG